MKTKPLIRKILDNFESIICQSLLVSFVLLLFIQILLREFFEYSIPWGEELATYMFVWFVFFGASYAAQKSAHNRVTFQFRFFSMKTRTYIEAFSDLIWVAFNLYFVYLSYDFVFNKMNVFWKSQTMGIQMKYFYMVLPIAFLLMSIRIIQNNYHKLVKGEDIIDPETAELEKIMEGDDENGHNSNKREES